MITHFIKTRLIPLSFIFSLVACAPPAPPEIQNEQQTKQSTTKAIIAAKHLSSWTLTGAIAAKSKKKSWTATINWKQQGLNRYQLRLFGPLGGNGVSVEKNGRIITYQDGQKRVKTTNIDQLFYKETGIHVPLHKLYYWVRGVQAPGAIQSSHYDASGRLTTLRQGGYVIHYDGYQTVNHVELPRKIKVTGSEGYLKLVIKHWEIH
ncbi:MAG: lipoprotein insertase outer membrane protein LolB [Gammaproteobacteria bacterium]|nr:lipoprotein insertase outer membrane protein LolB [Gammaproteobacteria bacterium]MCH9764208.1 lipoprotein insertase outer membrane protein LolB [Gammaproteobacteria bacterium]